jgi:Protein  of unknown function (DUF3018)
MNMEAPSNQDKFRRYRANKKAQGLKEVRMWVPDPSSERFKAEIAAFEEYQRNSNEERDIMAFIEAVADDSLKDIPPY